MNRRMQRLQNELTLDRAAPAPDMASIKRRVNAALNADPTERKTYTRQKMKLAAVLVAAVVALTGSAVAVASNLDVLQIIFKGDTSSAQELVDGKPRTVSNKDFSFTVESSASDGQSTYLAMRVDALNDAAADKLMSDGFGTLDTFHFYPVNDPHMAPPEDIYFAKTSGIHIPGSAPETIRGFGITELLDAKTDTARTWMVEVSLREETVASTLRARLCYMEADQFVEVALTPANPVTVKIGTSGQSSPTAYNRSGRPLTVERVTLTPFTCRVEVTTDSTLDYEPRIFFRMKDGTLYTQNRMMASTAGHGGANTASYSYRFHKVLDLTQLSGLVVFDREYPLDGSPSFPVAHDPALDIFELPLIPRLTEDGGHTVSVRALAEALGGTCTWDNATQTATLTYRDISIALTPGSKTALVNGRAVPLDQAPSVEDGKLIAGTDIFRNQWGVNLFAYYKEGTGDRGNLCWIVTP